MNSRPDRLKKRDDRYNTHHRNYCYLPSQDVDMMIFDKNHNPIIHLEMKHYLSRGASLDLKTDQHKRNANLADKLGIPYFVVYYVPDGSDPEVVEGDSGDFWEFRVFPRNQKALESLPRGGAVMSDFTYCSWLYELSGVTAAPQPGLSHQLSDLVWSKVQTDW